MHIVKRRDLVVFHHELSVTVEGGWAHGGAAARGGAREAGAAGDDSGGGLAQKEGDLLACSTTSCPRRTVRREGTDGVSWRVRQWGAHGRWCGE
jgi:hypothetical protein